MGDRILRHGIRTSEKAAANVRDGGWLAQVFYDWLITAVDDYGRYDARPAILRAEVFPLLLDLVREADVSRCLKSCETAGLIRLYTHDGKPYLELLNFKQRMRAANSRFPDPPAIVTHTHDNGMSKHTDTDTDTDTDTNPPYGGGADFPDGLQRFWSACPPTARDRSSRPQCLSWWKKFRLEPKADAIIAGLDAWKKSDKWTKDGGQYVQGAHLFLKQRKWEEPPQVNGHATGSASTLSFRERDEARARDAARQGVRIATGGR
jgi:hypothetical protein